MWISNSNKSVAINVLNSTGKLEMLIDISLNMFDVGIKNDQTLFNTVGVVCINRLRDW